MLYKAVIKLGLSVMATITLISPIHLKALFIYFEDKRYLYILICEKLRYINITIIVNTLLTWKRELTDLIKVALDPKLIASCCPS